MSLKGFLNFFLARNRAHRFNQLTIARLIMSCVVLSLLSVQVSVAHVPPKKVVKAEEEAIEDLREPIVFRVTGYAVYTKKEGETNDAKRLLAIRASKLDAYRAMAERVYGMSISGESSVKDFMLQSDSFGAAVDSYIRGARVVSVMENKQTGIETVLELVLPGNFQDCLNKANAFKYGLECLRPLSQLSSKQSGMQQNTGMDHGQSEGLAKSSSRMQSVYFLQ